MPTVHHGAVQASAGIVDADIEALIDQQGCGKIYEKVEECLGENNRDWRKCQTEVDAWKRCFQLSQGIKKATP